MTDIKLNHQGKPLKIRRGEVIGGGWFVFRRGEYGNRIKPGPLPYEHGTFESAQKEAVRLTEINPGQKFVILQDLAAVQA